MLYSAEMPQEVVKHCSFTDLLQETLAFDFDLATTDGLSTTASCRPRSVKIVSLRNARRMDSLGMPQGARIGCS